MITVWPPLAFSGLTVTVPCSVSSCTVIVWLTLELLPPPLPPLEGQLFWTVSV